MVSRSCWSCARRAAAQAHAAPVQGEPGAAAEAAVVRPAPAGQVPDAALAPDGEGVREVEVAADVEVAPAADGGDLGG